LRAPAGGEAISRMGEGDGVANARHDSVGEGDGFANARHDSVGEGDGFANARHDSVGGGDGFANARHDSVGGGDGVANARHDSAGEGNFSYGKTAGLLAALWLHNHNLDEEHIAEGLSIGVECLPSTAIGARLSGCSEQDAQGRLSPTARWIERLLGGCTHLLTGDQLHAVVGIPIAGAAVLDLPSFIEGCSRRNLRPVWDSQIAQEGQVGGADWGGGETWRF